MFGKLNTKQGENRIFTSGQGGKFTVDSGIYPATIKSFTMYQGEGESIKAILEVDLDMGNGNTRTYKQDMLLMNKEGNSTYPDKKTGKPINYEDVSIITEICNITCKKYLEDLEAQDTLIEIYDFDSKGKKPVQAQTVVELKGKQITLAILEYEEFKRENKNGKWVDTDEVRNKNKIDNVFQYESNKTLKELQAGSQSTVAYDTWNEYWAGKLKEAIPAKGAKKATKASTNAPNIPEINANSNDFGF